MSRPLTRRGECPLHCDSCKKRLKDQAAAQERKPKRKFFDLSEYQRPENILTDDALGG